MAAVEVVREAIWPVGDLGWQQDDTIVIFDSLSAIRLTKNKMYHQRTKLIDVRYHFIGEVLTQGDITIKKIVIVEIQ